MALRIITRQNKLSNLFWISIISISILYFFIKYFAPHYVTSLYHSGAFNVLNFLSGAKTPESLDFYQGRINDRVTGPLISTLSALVLIPLSLTFLRNSSFPSFLLFILSFLLITKFEVLTFPLYGEHIACSLTEAVWLKRHNFDYIGLLHQESSIYGGPKFYYFTVLPGFFAFLMKAIPSTKVFLVTIHVIYFWMSAVVITVTREILTKIFDKKIALLSSLLLLSLPLYQNQTETINMEIPCLFFIVLSIRCLIDKNIPAASLLAFLALSTKETGAIACVTVFLASIFLVLAQPRRFHIKMIGWGILLILLSLARLKLRSLFVHTELRSHNALSFFSGGHLLLAQKGILLVFVTGIVILIIMTFRFVQKHRGKNQSLLQGYLQQYYEILVMFTAVILWFGLHLNVSNLVPRYKFILMPFIVFCGIFSLAQLIRSKKKLKVVLTLAIIFYFFSSFGFLEPPISGYNTHIYSEKNLAYRNDLYLHKKIAEELEKNAPDMTIGAPFVTAHTLVFPEFGYVKKPFDVVMYNMDTTFGVFKNFAGLDELDTSKTIWIMFEGKLPGQIDPIDPHDRILGKIEFGDKNATLLLGGHGVNKSYLIKLLVLDIGLPQKEVYNILKRLAQDGSLEALENLLFSVKRYIREKKIPHKVITMEEIK